MLTPLPSLNSQNRNVVHIISSFYRTQSLRFRVGTLALAFFAILGIVAYFKFKGHEPSLDDRIKKSLIKKDFIKAWGLVEDVTDPAQKETWIDRLFPSLIELSTFNQQGGLQALEAAKATLDTLNREARLQQVFSKWLETKNFTACARYGLEIPNSHAILQDFCEKAIANNALDDAYWSAIVYIPRSRNTSEDIQIKKIREDLFLKLFHQAKNLKDWTQAVLAAQQTSKMEELLALVQKEKRQAVR